MQNQNNQSVESTVARAIDACGFAMPDSFSITRPAHDFGDYATSVAIAIGKERGESPRDAAQKIMQFLEKEADFSTVSVAGLGFINMRMSDQWYEQALNAPESLEQFLHGKKYIIEYSSPNIAKPMHVGHLRTTVLGQVLVNLYRKMGASVVAWSHPGDWGVQFGKLIVAWQKWGDEQALRAHPIDELLRVYVKFHQEEKTDPSLENAGKNAFHALQHGDAELLALWQRFTDLSMKEFDRMYKLLGVTFDVWRGESTYNDQLHSLVEKAVQADAAKESEGAVVIPMDDESVPPVLIQKSDGATLYATSDLVTIKTRVDEYHPDEMIYVVGNEQSLHLQQVFAAAQKLAKAGVYGESVHLPKLTHVSYGFFRLATGKMSTRQGELIRLEDVINQAVESARTMLHAKETTKLSQAQIEKLAPQLGVWAVKYTDLSHDRHTDVVFDFDKMFSFDGNSILYLLYTNARCNALLNQSEHTETVILGSEATPESDSGQARMTNHESWTNHERNLMLTSLEFEGHIRKSIEEYDPHHLLNHAYALASEFSRFYTNDPILKSSDRVRERRLQLVRLVQHQLHFVFDLLGMENLPERL